MMGFPDYDEYDALGLAGLVRDGAVSADELLDEALVRLDRLNPKLNVVNLRFEEMARTAIAAGLPDGPFTGVPFLLKDLGASMAGTPLTNGSRLYEDFFCNHDSTLVARYKRAGLVIFGRSTSPELGLSYATEPLLHGPARNPWNTDHVPGGSSGGSAAAVAARILPAAHASDGGGSIRVPSSCCGLFGMKPTRGRSPTGPYGGEGWGGMSVNHAVTISVRDSAALLDAIIGEDVGDPYASAQPARPFLDEAGLDPGPLRIAVSGLPSNGVPVDPDCIAAMDHAASLCADLGHHVEAAEPEYDREEIDWQRVKIIAACLRAEIETRAAQLGVVPEAMVEPMTWYIAAMADEISGADYSNAVETLHRVGRQMGRFFEDYDVLLTPTLAMPPLAIGVLDPGTDDTEAYAAAIQGFAAFPALSNATGTPAMSVPLYWNDAGLPIGAQFIARFGNEAALFRLAAQLEAAQPWAGKRPGITVT